MTQYFLYHFHMSGIQQYMESYGPQVSLRASRRLQKVGIKTDKHTEWRIHVFDSISPGDPFQISQHYPLKR